VFLGFFFIVLGVVSILVTTGYLNLDWGMIARLWPLALVFLGLALLTQLDIFYSLAGLAVIFSLIGMAGQGAGWFRSHTRTATLNRTLESSSVVSEKASLTFRAGAGEYSISGGGTKLVSAVTSTTHGDFMLSEEDPSDTLLSQNSSFTWSAVRNRADVMLSSVPVWDLNLDVGAAELHYDLSDLTIGKLVMKSGAVSGTLTFGTKADSANATLELGASSLVIRVPKELGVKVTLSSGLSGKEFNGFIQDGDQYQSEGYGATTKKLTLVIKAGVSNIIIERF